MQQHLDGVYLLCDTGGLGFGLGLGHHPGGAVGGSDIQASLGQPNGVFTGTAGEFQDVVAGPEMPGQHFPDARTEQPAQRGVGEGRIVVSGKNVEGDGINRYHPLLSRSTALESCRSGEAKPNTNSLVSKMSRILFFIDLISSLAKGLDDAFRGLAGKQSACLSYLMTEFS